MIRRAFTMLELVFVIVVIGILAASVLPMMQRNTIEETAHQVARVIRLAQHHALTDDVYDGSGTFGQKRWAVDLCQSQVLVSRIDGSQAAVDSLTKNDVNGTANDEFDFAVKHKVGSMTMATCNFSFDNFGRPRTNGANGGNLFANDMDITITGTNGLVAIVRVHADTGSVKIISIDGTILP